MKENASKTMATQSTSTQNQHPKIGPKSKGKVHSYLMQIPNNSTTLHIWMNL
jgi:hypothetical protein